MSAKSDIFLLFFYFYTHNLFTVKNKRGHLQKFKTIYDTSLHLYFNFLILTHFQNAYHLHKYLQFLILISYSLEIITVIDNLCCLWLESKIFF